MTLAVVSIVYGACLALVQDDIKKIIAYSSISHLGYVMLGLLSLELHRHPGRGDPDGEPRPRRRRPVPDGRHDLRALPHARAAAYGGLAKLLPVYSVFFMILTLASVGLPTTSGFTGEFLVLLGAFKAAWPLHRAATTCRWCWPRSRSPASCSARSTCCASRSASCSAPARAPHQPVADLGGREKAILGAIVAAVFALGLFPDEPMQKTELAAKAYRQLVATPRLAARARHERRHAVLTAMLPEHLLLLGIVLLIGLEIAGRGQRAALAVAFVCVAAAAAAAARLALDGYAAAPFAGQFSVDPSTLLVKAMVLAFALPVLLMSRDEFAGGEFPVLLLSSLYGVCLLQSADSFPTLFLGLELMSLPVYVLVLLAYRRPESAEAALKYLVLGGTATAMFLMGASLLYGSERLARDRRIPARARQLATGWRAPPSSSWSWRSS